MSKDIEAGRNFNTVPRRVFFWDWRATLLVVICSALFFGELGEVPFYSKQEPREALVVWEIIHSGNWILPLRNGNEIPSKPPLYHWLAALVSQSANQLNEFTVRFPSAFLGTLAVLLTYLAGASLWGRSAGLVAALILSTSFEWQQTAKVARVDMTLTFAMLCAFLFFLYLYRTGGGKGKAVILGLLMGLATLAKGPLGFVVPLCTYLVFLWLRRDLLFVKRLHPLMIVGTCAIVAGSWYGLALWQQGTDFLAVVVKENFTMTIGQEAGHPHPFYWYIPILFKNMAPWSLFFIPLGISLYRARRHMAQKELLYFVVWFSTVFIFFSAFTQKRSVYILPLYPAVALLFGAWWQELKGRPSSSFNWLARPAAYFNAGAFLLLSGILCFQILGSGIFPFIRLLLHPKDQAEFLVLTKLLLEHRIAVFFWATVCGLGGVFLIVAARKDAWGPFFGCMTVLMVTSLLFVQKFDFHVASQYSFKSFVRHVLTRINDAPLYLYGSGDYGVVFYADKRVPVVHREMLAADRSTDYLLFWEKDWQRFAAKDDLSLLDSSDSTDSMGRGRLFLVASHKKQSE